jgi:hypothetical protein
VAGVAVRRVKLTRGLLAVVSCIAQFILLPPNIVEREELGPGP